MLVNTIIYSFEIKFLVVNNYLLVETINKCLSSIGFGKSVVLIKQSCDLILTLFLTSAC